MDKPAPREEDGLSDETFRDWLESHMLGLWPENEGIEDTLPSED